MIVGGGVLYIYPNGRGESGSAEESVSGGVRGSAEEASCSRGELTVISGSGSGGNSDPRGFAWWSGARSTGRIPPPGVSWILRIGTRTRVVGSRYGSAMSRGAE